MITHQTDMWKGDFISPRDNDPHVRGLCLAEMDASSDSLDFLGFSFDLVQFPCGGWEGRVVKGRRDKWEEKYRLQVTWPLFML